jgi:hypothetical protein
MSKAPSRDQDGKTSQQRWNARNRERVLSYQKQWNLENREHTAHENRRRRYGVSREQYDEILDRQDGLCAICRGPEKRMIYGRLRPLAVDHNHVTGQIRGLLCSSCNQAIGFFDEDEQKMVAAIAYLAEHSE